MTAHSSILAWAIPLDREAWWATSSVPNNWTQLKWLGIHAHTQNETEKKKKKNLKSKQAEKCKEIRFIKAKINELENQKENQQN